MFSKLTSPRSCAGPKYNTAPSQNLHLNEPLGKRQTPMDPDKKEILKQLMIEHSQLKGAGRLSMRVYAEKKHEVLQCKKKIKEIKHDIQELRTRKLDTTDVMFKEFLEKATFLRKTINRKYRYIKQFEKKYEREKLSLIKLKILNMKLMDRHNIKYQRTSDDEWETCSEDSEEEDAVEA